MIDKILNFIGYVRCKHCKRWTEPSIIFGNVCSMDCVTLEDYPKSRLARRE